MILIYSIPDGADLQKSTWMQACGDTGAWGSSGYLSANISRLVLATLSASLLLVYFGL